MGLPQALYKNSYIPKRKHPEGTSASFLCKRNLAGWQRGDKAPGDPPQGEAFSRALRNETASIQMVNPLNRGFAAGRV